jgi:hypothetical protein
MSLYINNFSIQKDEVRYCTSLIDLSVDVIDDFYEVTLSGTYINCNDQLVPFSTVNITNGYRLTYNTLPSGTLEYKVYASNSNNDFLEHTYIMQFGYEVMWGEVNNWKPNSEIPIAVTATNSVYNPNTVYFSTFFTTSYFKEYDLEAFISAGGSGQSSLFTSISPQNKYFMYGRTYNITISGIKDFSGNVLPAKTYTFKLEDNLN